METDSLLPMGKDYRHIFGHLLVDSSVEPVGVPIDLIAVPAIPVIQLHLLLDYFCESVETADSFHTDPFQFFPDNALWDGQDLINPCYGNNNPPWFNKILPTPTTDDIDTYVCLDSSEQLAGIALQLLEIYVR